MFENSDDYDFIPSGSSRLASLFDGSILPNNKSSSLTYTAPKQPKPKKDIDKDESQKSKAQTSLVIAKVVAIWKLEDNDYKTLGKYGLAIIGSLDLNLFEVISYKEKNNIILRRKINDSFNFYNQNDNFSSFYDNKNQNWLVKFENLDDQDVFTKEVKKYGGNITFNTDSTAKSTSRTKENRVKPNILSKESIVPKPEALPRLSQMLEKETEDSDSSGSQKRANILSRMAKMGQQILSHDILTNRSSDVSDSELDDSKNDSKVPPRRFKRSVPLEKPIPKEEKVQQEYVGAQMMPVPVQNNLNFTPQFSQQNMVGYSHNVVPTFPPNMISPVLMNQSVPYDGFNQYIISQNAELKMNLAQISAKLDGVLNISNRSDSKCDDSSLKSKIKTLELRSENLLTELEKYEIKYSDLQEKCKNLEKKGNETEHEASVIERLNKEIEILKGNLKISEERISDLEKLEIDVKKYRSDIEEYEKIIEAQKSKLHDLEEFYEQNKDNVNLQSTVDDLNDTVSNLKQKLKDFEEHFIQVEAEKQKRIEKNEKIINGFSDKIKDHMNNMYLSILASFEDNNSYTASQIKSQVAQNLKGATFAIIEEFTDMYRSDNE